MSRIDGGAWDASLLACTRSEYLMIGIAELDVAVMLLQINMLPQINTLFCPAFSMPQIQAQDGRYHCPQDYV